ncbi:MAG TPA: NUDIX domain-containing protein [Candidatus Saccharimonadales bacterium]|nr:NUDIX domain-containing protein [Candidatus Saccharimonadales bacterium]
MAKKIKPASDKIDSRRGVDYIGVTTPFIIHDGQGRILLQKRSKNCRDEQGRWDVGGGSMEFGEDWEQSVRREVKEELCVEALEVKFLKAFNALRNNGGTFTHWVALVHSVLVDPSKVRIGEPHKIDEIGWFTLKDLPEPLHSQIGHGIDAALEAGILAE